MKERERKVGDSGGRRWKVEGAKLMYTCTKLIYYIEELGGNGIARNEDIQLLDAKK